MKTAVEWLESEFVKLEHSIGVHQKMYELIEQAKEMEKQQIIDAYNIGFITPIEFDFNTCKSVVAEEYYNETFKKK
jgi:hypothetical protein